MFERASLIHPGVAEEKLDVGRILESMLYYSHIDALIDARVLPALWFQLGSAGTRDLLKHPSLHVEITPEMPVVQNDSRNNVKTHRPIFISSAGRDGGQFDPHKDAARSIHQLINNRQTTPLSEVRKLVAEFPKTSYNKLFSAIPSRGDLFESLIGDSDSMRIFLKAFANARGFPVDEEALEKLRVDIMKIGDSFLIANNIELSNIVRAEPALQAWDEILPFVLDYSHDLHLSQARSADVITNQSNSYIASQRIDMSIERASHSENLKSSFEEFAFDEARPFREAFNSGRLSLAEALEVIDKTAKFREWLNGLPPGVDIIKEYHRAVNRDTILGKLPGKGARFAVFTGAGVGLDLLATGGVGTLAGLGLSAFDSFVLDGLLKGWRPNHFVDRVQRAIG